MGEYAEMMLDGTCCAQCGDFLGSNAGVPIYCRDCGGDENGFIPEHSMTRKQKADRAIDKGEHVTLMHTAAPGQEHKPWRCECGRRFRLESGARQHWRDLHASPAKSPKKGE